jgi:hypothetical protein
MDKVHSAERRTILCPLWGFFFQSEHALPDTHPDFIEPPEGGE